jgi:hypothetical protein
VIVNILIHVQAFFCLFVCLFCFVLFFFFCGIFILNDMSINLQFQAFDFRTTTRNEPFLQLFHCLYVYPLTVSLSRKRNLFIRVELREDDADVRRQPLEVNALIYIFKAVFFLNFILFHMCNYFD